VKMVIRPGFESGMGSLPGNWVLPPMLHPVAKGVTESKKN